MVTVMVALAEGHLFERKLAEWLQAHTGKRKGRGTGGSG
jgi:hypothetical protein